MDVAVDVVAHVGYHSQYEQRREIVQGIAILAQLRQLSHAQAKQEECCRDEQGADGAVVLRLAIRQGILSYSKHISLIIIEIAKGKTAEEHRRDDARHTGAVLLMYIIGCHFFFLRTTAERAGM